MEIKTGDWVLVSGFDFPGKVRQVIGENFSVDFLVLDVGRNSLKRYPDFIPIFCVDEVIKNEKEITELKKLARAKSLNFRD